MSSQPEPTDALELTYGEIREAARMLACFTATDLAHLLGVDHEVGVRAIEALCMHKICRNSGDLLDGRNGYEYVIEYVPVPAGPSQRERGPDPVQVAVSQAGRISVQRGLPVRIRTGRMVGRALSTPGQRQKHKNNEREYQRQKEAKESRAAAQRGKAQQDPKWKKHK